MRGKKHAKIDAGSVNGRGSVSSGKTRGINWNCCWCGGAFAFQACLVANSINCRRSCQHYPVCVLAD